MTNPATTVTDLWARGFAALPTPREVRLEAGERILNSGCSVVLGPGVVPKDVAVTTCVEGLAEHVGQPVALASQPSPQAILLEIKPGTVATDAPKAISAQGYRLVIAADRITVTGNAPVGLFYGVHTLLQLLRRAPDGRLELPLGQIDDWPDRELRMLHYDTKHHQDRLETVKAMIVRAAAFKANAIAWEIEDKFAYRKHPLVSAPGAFSAAQLQEIAAHALRHYVELVPILQGPSHFAFVLKHEKYAYLREDVRNNYMICPTREESYELLFSMYDELLEATPGCRYFHIGTDEPYFLGDSVECGCRARRDQIGAGGMMAEFIARCTAHLVKKGRTVMCWGESPMRPPDVSRLPGGIINAVFQNPAMAEEYRKKGIRELIYCPTQGARALFPEYFSMGTPQAPKPGRMEELYRVISHGPARPFDPLGIIVGTWDDSGLHLESFWLGWALGLAYGWSPGRPAPDEAAAQFMRIFHGAEAVQMADVYRRLDRLANYWSSAWDRTPSRRGAGYKRQWHPRYDRTLALPRIPDPDTLDNQPFFTKRYAELLASAERANEDLGVVFDRLLENLGRARRNRYALEVFLSLAYLVQDHVRLLLTLSAIESTLDQARQDCGGVCFKPAAARVREAAQKARAFVAERESMFAKLVATWERSRCPKGQSVDGRSFVHIQDNTKDHEADWTPDLGYLVMASRELHLEAWADRVDAVALEFAKRHPDDGKGWRPGGGSADVIDED